MPFSVNLSDNGFQRSSDGTGASFAATDFLTTGGGTDGPVTGATSVSGVVDESVLMSPLTVSSAGTVDDEGEAVSEATSGSTAAVVAGVITGSASSPATARSPTVGVPVPDFSPYGVNAVTGSEAVFVGGATSSRPPVRLLGLVLLLLLHQHHQLVHLQEVQEQPLPLSLLVLLIPYQFLNQDYKLCLIDQFQYPKHQLV